MNTPADTTAKRNSTTILLLYLAAVLFLLAGLISGRLPSAMPEGGIRDYAEGFIFCIIAILGVIAIQRGGAVAPTLSIGTWGGFVALTIGQDDALIRYLTFGAVLFSIGMYGMVVSRNAVRVLMSIELMLNAVNINLVAFARYVDPVAVKGQVFAIFILTVAAAEAAVGLAIVLAIYRNMATVDMERFNLLKW
jgi:NAD(P)H-quinone oxidoreductase subunit 4L